MSFSTRNNCRHFNKNLLSSLLLLAYIIICNEYVHLYAHIYLPKTKKFGCVGGETRLLFSFQKLRNRQKSGETCQVTWEVRRVLRVDRRTAKIMP